MKIVSSAFQDQASIPSRYTCDGRDINPPLAFREIPKGAKSLALIVDDPDAPNADHNWDHWIVWNIPPNTDEVREGEAPKGVVGRNSWGKSAYGGPAPPDRAHRYFFKLYALDTKIDLPSSAGKPELEKAMQGHIVEQAQLIGRYDRKR